MSDYVQFTQSMSVELVEVNASDEHVLRAMLVSTLRDQIEMDYKAKKGRIGYLMRYRHGSPFEHTSFTFRIDAPIAVFREWHRHRIGWSYNEQSGRYTEMRPLFYVPPQDRPLVQVGKPGEYTFIGGEQEQYMRMVNEITVQCTQAWLSYQRMLEAGIAKEVARGVLPVYTMSTMYATCNARSLMAFLSLRTENDNALFRSTPMREIAQCAELMEECFQEHMPLTADAFHTYGRVAP